VREHHYSQCLGASSSLVCETFHERDLMEVRCHRNPDDLGGQIHASGGVARVNSGLPFLLEPIPQQSTIAYSTQLPPSRVEKCHGGYMTWRTLIFGLSVTHTLWSLRRIFPSPAATDYLHHISIAAVWLLKFGCTDACSMRPPCRLPQHFPPFLTPCLAALTAF
jgi:hypothetical protein